MILPVSTTHYQPMYIYQDSVSDKQKCLERAEHADILQKTLKDEQLTDEETERIAACVKEQKQSNKTAVLIYMAIIVVLIVFGIGMVIMLP